MAAVIYKSRQNKAHWVITTHEGTMCSQCRELLIKGEIHLRFISRSSWTSRRWCIFCLVKNSQGINKKYELSLIPKNIKNGYLSQRERSKPENVFRGIVSTVVPRKGDTFGRPVGIFKSAKKM